MFMYISFYKFKMNVYLEYMKIDYWLWFWYLIYPNQQLNLHFVKYFDIYYQLLIYEYDYSLSISFLNEFIIVITAIF